MKNLITLFLLFIIVGLKAQTYEVNLPYMVIEEVLVEKKLVLKIDLEKGFIGREIYSDKIADYSYFKHEEEIVGLQIELFGPITWTFVINKGVITQAELLYNNEITVWTR